MGGAIEITTRRLGGALYVRVNGLFGLEESRRLREAVRREAHSMPVKVLVDFRGTVMLLADETMSIVIAESLDSPVELSIGWLVGLPNRQVAWTYCSAMAETGRTRVVFTSAQRAAAWAGLQEADLAPHREFQPASHR